MAKGTLKNRSGWDGLKYEPVVNRTKFSPWCIRAGNLPDFCKSQSLVVEAYAPLAHRYKTNNSKLRANSMETSKGGRASSN